MARILGIDFGEKRIGLALSDELFILAHPFKTIEVENIKRTISEIEEICLENEVKTIVLGLPKTFKNKFSSQTKEVQRFAKEIKKEIKIPVVFEDERLSTKAVYKSLPKDIIKKQKKNIDQLSAQIILQSYLDKLERNSK